MLTHFFGDLRYAARRLAAAPGFTAAAVITIALGVGINTGIFSVLNGIAFRDLPAPDADELVSVYPTRQTSFGSVRRFSTSEYRALRDGTKTLSGILAYTDGTTVTLGGDAPPEIAGTLVSCNYFVVLRHRPQLGPGLANDCDAEGAAPTVVLGHDLWTTAFGADESIVGREVQLNRQAFLVVGVAPEGMRGVDLVLVQFFRAPFVAAHSGSSARLAPRGRLEPASAPRAPGRGRKCRGSSRRAPRDRGPYRRGTSIVRDDTGH